MQFGASTFIWVSPFSSDAFYLLEKVKAMGYDILEVAVEDKSLINWAVLKKRAKEAGLQITISGAFGPERDISSTNAEYRKTGLQYIIDCIHIAAEMESPVFTGPVYSAVGKTRLVSEIQKKEERNWCLEQLSVAAEVAAASGVTVGVEPLNRFETDMINTADQALSLVKELEHPNIRISLDTFHCNIEEKNIAGTIRKVGKEYLCHVQGNESDRGTPGTAHLDWSGINDALKEIDYDGAMVIETFGAPSKELAKAACIWRPLANSADELASEGLVFYKRTFR